MSHRGISRAYALRPAVLAVRALLNRRRLAVLLSLGAWGAVCITQPVLAAGGTNDTPVPRLRPSLQINQISKQNKTVKHYPVGIPWVVTDETGRSDNNTPSFLLAQKISGRVDDVIEAQDDVEWRKTDMWLFADRLSYSAVSDWLTAEGNVHLLQPGMRLDTPKLKSLVGRREGVAENADYHFVREVPRLFYRADQLAGSNTTLDANGSITSAPMLVNVAHSYGLPTRQPEGTRWSESSGHAEKIEFRGRDEMRLKNATYSTCSPNDVDWYLQSPDVDLDFAENQGSAANSSLWFKGVPIFYAPYFTFPVKRERKSGFLAPTYTSSTKNGFDLTVPYYFNIAPNYDLTLFPRVLSKRGFQLGAEGRYLTPLYRGEVRGEYMPHDRLYGKSRSAWQVRHWHTLSSNVGAYVDWGRVSDPWYWQDMSSRLLQISQVHVTQQVMVSWQALPWLNVNVQNTRYQTLQTDPKYPVSQPYFIQPQINVSGYKPNILNKTADFNLIAQYSHFTHPTQTNGERLVLYPQMSWPMMGAAWQITPKVGMHMTHYQLSKQSESARAAGHSDQISRVLPTFTLDSSLVFERDTTWNSENYRQTLEPRLFYVYIPYRDQSRIPVFDTGVTDFNFAQVFAENRYSGYDRINDANQLTAAVTSRFIGAKDGVEYMKFMLGQRYYFSPQKVRLSDAELDRGRNFSNVIASVAGRVVDKTYAEMALEYNHREATTERFSVGARFQPDYGRVLSASYRYTRDSLSKTAVVDQVDIAGQWPLADISPVFKRWYGVGRYNYSLRDNRLLEGIAGLEYNAGCWSMRFVAQRLTALSNGQSNTTLFFQLELKDFASVGSNPIQLLRRSVPGYGKSNELPVASNLLP